METAKWTITLSIGTEGGGTDEHTEIPMGVLDMLITKHLHDVVDLASGLRIRTVVVDEVYRND